MLYYLLMLAGVFLGLKFLPFFAFCVAMVMAILVGVYLYFGNLLDDGTMPEDFFKGRKLAPNTERVRGLMGFVVPMLLFCRSDTELNAEYFIRIILAWSIVYLLSGGICSVMMEMNEMKHTKA